MGDERGGRELPLRVALALCRWVVAWHPPSFRARFGAQVRRDYRALAEAERGRPWRGAWLLLRRAAQDAVRSVPREWLRALRRRVRGGPAGAASRGSSGRSAGVGSAAGRSVAHAPAPGGVRARAARWLSDLVRDARYGVRSLARDLRFSVAAVLVLGVGIGVNAAVFSVANAYLLRPLPFPEPERLVAVETVLPVSWREAEGVFEHVVSWDLDAFTLVDGDSPELVRGAWVTPGYFDAFGIRAQLGRTIRPGEGGAGGAAVALISHELWQRRYGGDPSVIGRAVTTYSSDRPDDAESFVIIGVLPRDFWFFNRYTDFLAPLRADNPVYMGRLAPGVPIAEAERRMLRLAEDRLEEAGAAVEFRLRPYHDRYVEEVRPKLLALLVAVGCVLLIACVNAAVLLLVRASGRQRELAVRRALGAHRGRLARQLAVEGLLLAGAAAALGLGLAAAALGPLRGAVEDRLGRAVPGGAAMIQVDGTVILVALAITLAVGVVFGLVPLAAGLRARFGDALAGGARGATETRGRRRLRGALVAAELALSLALLIGAGLAIASARHLARLELGFDPTGRVKAEVNIRERSYPEPADRVEFHDRLMAAARAIPGVEAAGSAVRAPLTWNFGTDPMEAEGRPVTDPATAPGAIGTVVGPGYFRAMGIPLLRGRGFGPDDRAGAEPVAVVSEGLAARLWPDAEPLGRRFREVPSALDRSRGQAEPGPWRTVIGVVPAVRNALGPDDPPDYYVPYTQLPPTSLTVIMRVRDGAGSPIPALEDAAQRLDPTVAVTAVQHLEDAARTARAPSRFLAGALLAFAAFALLLAVLGLYGVVAYAAAQRRRDIAVRMALGADARSVVRLFVGRTLPVIAAGLLLGLLGGAGLGRVLDSQLTGIDPFEPALYASVAAALAGAALLASWLPARGAAKADPASVLREE